MKYVSRFYHDRQRILRIASSAIVLLSRLLLLLLGCSGRRAMICQSWMSLLSTLMSIILITSEGI